LILVAMGFVVVPIHHKLESWFKSKLVPEVKKVEEEVVEK